MNKIEFVKDKIPFTQVANGVLTDKRLSAKAKGLYAYLYSKPDGWNFAIDRIALEMADGRKSINEGLKELEVLGFLTRQRQADGRVVYMVHFPPIEPNAQNGHEANPNAQKAIVPKSHMTEMGTVSNKDIKVIKNISNKELAKPTVLQGSDWNRLIDNFKDINPLYEDFYKNTTERKALEYLASKIGVAKLEATIKALPEIISKPYAPKITKPTELKRDLGKLLTFYKQDKNKGKSFAVIL